MNKIQPVRNFEFESTDGTTLKYVKLNVRGYKYKVPTSLLEKFPGTRLNQLRYEENKLSLCDDYDCIKNEYYFNKDPFIFNQILNYMSTNELHLNKNECVASIRNELNYWKIDDNLIKLCCKRNYNEFIHLIDDYENKINDLIDEQYSIEEFGTCLASFRFHTWNLLTNPESSLLARCIHILNILLILYLPTETMIRTLPSVKSCSLNYKYNNHTKIFESNCSVIEPQIELIGYFCVFILAIESVIRFLCCPKKLKFIMSPLNIIDFVCVVPFIICTFLSLDGNLNTNNSLLAVSLIRTFLLLKIFHYSDSLKLLVLTLKQSFKQLIALVFYVLIGLVLFASLLFYFEKDQVILLLNFLIFSD